MRQQSNLMLRSSAGRLQPLPFWIWAATTALAIWGATTQYPWLTVASVVTLPVVTSLLLIKGESPILFWCIAMQWLQVTTPIFYCDFCGRSLNRAFEYPNMERATALSLVGILVISVGMRISLGRWSTATAVMENEAGKLSLPRLFNLWWISFFIGALASAVAWKFKSLGQVTIPFSSLKWVLAFMLIYCVILRGKGFQYLILTLLLEFVVGIVGPFASFKDVFFMALIVIMSMGRVASARVRFIVVIIVVLGITSSVFWSIAKIQYRPFLAEQSGRPGGLSFLEKVEAMHNLASTMDAKKMNDGFFRLIDRVSYTQFFGSTLEHVPAREPHAGGELWLGAIKHILTPRLLFPNKEGLDDSERARKYTGLRLAGAEEGTSIGIGYMAESYVDFGTYGMFVPIFILGLTMGFIFRRFTLHHRSRLLGCAFATAILFSMLQAYAASNVKLLGGLVAECLVFWVLYVAFGTRAMSWLSKGGLSQHR